MTLFEILVHIALVLWIVLALGLLVGLLYAAPALRDLRAISRRTGRLAGLLENRVDPLVDRATAVADNAAYITASMRADVDAVGRTVDHATGAMDRVIAALEARAADLNGLLEVMQEELEDALISTAALLRRLPGRGRRGRAEDDRRPRPPIRPPRPEIQYAEPGYTQPGFDDGESSAPRHATSEGSASERPRTEGAASEGAPSGRAASEGAASEPPEPERERSRLG